MTIEGAAAELHAVVGGSGAIGRAVVEELVRRGHRVRSVARRAPTTEADFEVRLADVMDREEAIEAVAGASVVYQCAMPAYTRWAQEFPALQANVADAAEQAGARLVVAENLYMYGPTDGPMRETTPMAATGKKGMVRARLSRDLLQRHAEGRLRVAIGRASDYYGPGAVNSAVGEQFFAAVARDKAVRWMGRLDQPHALSYLPDIAAGLVTLGEHPEADGEAWHLPVSQAMTGAEWSERTAAIAGRQVTPSRVSRPTLIALGLFMPTLRELRETLYQWERPWLVDDSKFREAFGATATDVDDGIRRTLESFRFGEAKS
jgi:nucleoside-diphosphate-sugar epimerase